MAKKYRHTAMMRVIGAVASWSARRGMGRSAVLTTTGWKTGDRHDLPVSPITVDGAEYLVAPYGPVAWVKNVRAGGETRLRHGDDDAIVMLDEVRGEEAARVVAAYHRRESFARQYMDVPDDPTVEDFAARADQFPVFRVARA